MIKNTTLLMLFIYITVHSTPIPAYSKSFKNIYPEEITELTETECQLVTGGVIITSSSLIYTGIILTLTGLTISAVGIGTGMAFLHLYPDKSTGMLIGAPLVIGSLVIGGTIVQFGVVSLAFAAVMEECDMEITFPNNNNSLTNEILLYPDSTSPFTETQHLELSFF